MSIGNNWFMSPVECFSPLRGLIKPIHIPVSFSTPTMWTLGKSRVLACLSFIFISYFSLVTGKRLNGPSHYEIPNRFQSCLGLYHQGRVFPLVGSSHNDICTTNCYHSPEVDEIRPRTCTYIDNLRYLVKEFTYFLGSYPPEADT